MMEIYCRTCRERGKLTAAEVAFTNASEPCVVGRCPGCGARTAFLELSTKDARRGNGQWANAGLIEDINCDQVCFRVPGAILQALIRRLARVERPPLPDAFLRGEENPHAVSAFDPQNYMAALRRVRIEPGYVLDYVFATDGRGGEPFLYARKATARPLATLKEYFSAYPETRPEMLLGDEPTEATASPYLRHMRFDSHALGYLEFAYFVMVARRFYLYWHSCYNTRTYPTTWVEAASCTRGLNKHDSLDWLWEIDPAPLVTLSKEGGTVRLLSMEINNGLTYLCIECRPPNTLVGVEDDTIKSPTYSVRF